MNKRIEEKAKDVSNHGTLIAAKRQEIASLTAQIETKLTRQGPAVATVEAESRRTSSRMQNCRVQKRRRPWPAREIWKPRNSQPFTKQRSSMASQSASTVEVELPNSRLWLASSICGGQHSNSYIQIDDEVVCLLNAELDGDDSKKLCCIMIFDEISAEKMIRSD